MSKYVRVMDGLKSNAGGFEYKLDEVIMKKLDYIYKINELFKENNNSKKILLEQVDNYYNCSDNININHTYKVGDDVYLKKGTLLHGTYKNMDGLRSIVENGLISSLFVDGRLSKYPGGVGIWNLKKDYYLKDYISFYSGRTVEYKEIDGKVISTDVISYDDMNKLLEKIDASKCFRWFAEQTKEARFLPSLVQNEVQVGIIFDGNNEYIKDIMKNDILSTNISDEDVKEFVNPDYYDKFIVDRLNKDDFFTDRESAILFGIPSVFIEGILVGRKYEKDNKILSEIKKLLPNTYICNLDDKVIKE